MKATIDWNKKQIAVGEPVKMRELTKHLSSMFIDWEEWEVVPEIEPQVTFGYVGTATPPVCDPGCPTYDPFCNTCK